MDNLNYLNNKFKDFVTGKLPTEISYYTREQMAALFDEMNFKVGAEIGVCRGGFSETLCQKIAGLRLFGIDSWEPYPEYSDYKLRKTFNKILNEALERLEQYSVVLINRYSKDAVKDFDDETLDFVYIDANHEYSFVLEDIRLWTPKVKKNGIVAGHDYDRVSKNNGENNLKVADAIKQYIEEEHINNLFVFGESDDARSWMFVRE